MNKSPALLIGLFLIMFGAVAPVSAACRSGSVISGAGYLCTAGGLKCPGQNLCCDAVSECTTPSDEPLCKGLGVNTALGCLLAGDPNLFIRQLLGWGAGLGVGIAFLLIIFAGFQVVTSAGDPKRAQAGRELLTAAISGLMLIFFAVLLLNFIGVNILNLPGFVGNPNLDFIP